MFEKSNFFSAAFTLAENHFNLIKDPKNIQEIEKNQFIRDQSVSLYQGNKGALKGAELIAVKKFWSTQIYFFITFVLRNRTTINLQFPDLIPVDFELSKKPLVALLDKFLHLLQHRTPGIETLITLICEDCRLMELDIPLPNLSAIPNLSSPIKISDPAISSQACAAASEPPQTPIMQLFSEPAMPSQAYAAASEPSLPSAVLPLATFSVSPQAHTAINMPHQIPFMQSPAELASAAAMPMQVPMPANGPRPMLFIRVGNAIKFAKMQALMGKRVLIMDAANAQRPGAAAYDKGTLQEDLTRHTDLYWKILADFHNVLRNLKDKQQLAFNIEDAYINGINVLAYQADFLSLILSFVRHTIDNENYFANEHFRSLFFATANRIYGRMQNKVFEIPSDAGFFKNVCFTDLDDINSPSELFTNGHFKQELLARNQGRFFVVEVAAPDQRKTEGAYDRASTVNSVLRQSNVTEIAAKMLQSSIEYTITTATYCRADIILLNAFGCGAFENKPAVVAKIFAETLQKYSQQLCGKQIYFMDLKEEMCNQFGAYFSGSLANHYDINLYVLNSKLKLCILPSSVPSTITGEDVIIAAYDSIVAKKTAIQLSPLSPTPILNKQILIRELKGLAPELKTKKTLQKAYEDAIQSALRVGYKRIHLPLVGTGKLGFSMADSFTSLINLLQELSLSDRLNLPQINLYLPETEKYSAAIKMLSKYPFNP